MKPVFVLCFVLMFFVHDGQGTVNDFFNQVGHAFSVTWNSVVDAIKRPVRLKKLGPGAQRKALRAITTHMPYIWSSPKDSEIFLNDMSKKSAADMKVTLPLLSHPKYRSLETWMKMQKIHDSTTPKSTPNLKFKAVFSDDSGKLSNDESNIFGPLVFI